MPHYTSTDRKDRPETREPGRFYVDELSKLLNRRSDTIRRWEGSGRLPRHLIPRRGARDWRYWTDNQVYGSRGIIAWMKREDMRPGNFFADPSQEENHIRRLRVPRMISEEMLEEIHRYSYVVSRGKRKGQWYKSREWIIKTYYPRSGYLSVENFLRAVTRYFAERGWPFPPPAPRKYKKKRPAHESVKIPPDIRAIEREADRLIRITSSK